ncbi:MAG: hypothetical protein HN919_03590 [Verrucomicrobia bacterium]|mgnify:FL=1|jgi:hypothetical protein|nr:hypothetical protein [Verrucomicrobiota bacterium]
MTTNLTDAGSWALVESNTIPRNPSQSGVNTWTTPDPGAESVFYRPAILRQPFFGLAWRRSWC